MIIKKILGLLPHQLEEALKLEKEMRDNQEGNYCPIFGRWWIHRHWYFDNLHKTTVLKRAKELFGEDIKPSYSGVSLYCEDWSICPPHTDRPQCKYSLDLCLKHDEPWPIYVNDKKWTLQENEALVYSGTDHYHWRDRVKAGNKVTMVFFHFVDSDFAGPLD